MVQLLDPLLIVALALNFVALGVSRIRGVINAVALQGILLGILAALRPPGHRRSRCILLVVVTIVLKGFVIPAFLVHAMREANIQHEVKPVVELHELPAPGGGRHRPGDGVLVHASRWPTSTRTCCWCRPPSSTVWTGFLMLTTRRKAIMQVLGYLLLENGIFLFGLLLLEAMPFLVEVGVLLDLFTGVFVMGIIIHHISREFASISTEHSDGVEGITDELLC